MRLRIGLEVVGLVRVREHRVDEGRGDDRRAEVRRHDRGLRRSALRAREADCHFPGLQARARNHGRDRVEDAMLRVTDDVPGQRLLTGRGHVAGHASGQICDGHSLFAGRRSRLTSKRRGRRHEHPGTAADQAAPGNLSLQSFPPGAGIIRYQLDVEWHSR